MPGDELLSRDGAVSVGVKGAKELRDELVLLAHWSRCRMSSVGLISPLLSASMASKIEFTRS